jgi:lipopolysaccharide/colanic/teichoic acid biosynthesis glycosyltransferase
VLKRAFDIIVSGAGLILLSPLFVFIGVLIKLDSQGSIFFLGRRVGKDGKIFYILKFRSMEENAVAKGPVITVAGDARVTRIGKYLRKTKIDELPQLCNVVKGDMSLVGPRPEDPRYVALYSDTQKQVLRVRPGLTSPSSIQFSNEESLLAVQGLDAYETMIMPQKLAADLEYVRCHSFIGDLMILLQTVAQVLNKNWKSLSGFV